MRAKVAMVRAPSAIDGMMSEANPSAPDVGNHRNFTPNSRINRMPDQNVGRL